MGEQVDERAVDLDRFADKAEIEHALDIAVGIDHLLVRLFGKDHVAVLAAKADGPFALGIDQRDDLLVDRTGQDHFDDLDGLFVGDAQAALEPRFDAHLFEHVPDLRPAAMHDDGVDLGLFQAGRCRGRRPCRAPASPMAWPPYLTTTVLPS